MVRFSRLLILAFGLGCSAPLMAADPGSADYHLEWERSGDLLQFVLPLAGVGLSFLLDSPAAPATRTTDPEASLTQTRGVEIRWPGPQIDGRTRHDFVVGLLRMETATYAIKYALDETRPNGANRSFPSGHTASAFFGAEYIRQNYGPWAGLPAYAAAGWVGYTRVYSQHHYWHDVFAGALLGIMSNWNDGQIPTRWGLLKIAPGLINSPGRLLGHQDDRDSPPGIGRSSPTLGLTLRLDL